MLLETHACMSTRIRTPRDRNKKKLHVKISIKRTYDSRRILTIVRDIARFPSLTTEWHDTVSLSSLIFRGSTNSHLQMRHVNQLQTSNSEGVIRLMTKHWPLNNTITRCLRHCEYYEDIVCPVYLLIQGITPILFHWAYAKLNTAKETHPATPVGSRKLYSPDIRNTYHATWVVSSVTSPKCVTIILEVFVAAWEITQR